MNTPIEHRDTIYFKRDDLFEFHGLRGAKVRQALYLIDKAQRQGYTKVTTVGHRKSPQIHIVGTLCEHFGLEFVGHTPQGELPEAFRKFNIVQHRAGYNNVIAARCHQFAKENGYFEVPFGMVCHESMMLTSTEVSNIPRDTKRIIIPVGSGVNLCGVLKGMRALSLKIPVVGVVVGKSPVRLLNEYAPFGWQSHVTLIDSPMPYAKAVKDCMYMGIELDPIYEAKCVPYVEPNDLFWLVGIRNF